MKTKLPCVKSAVELGITKEQRKNLAKLTVFVDKKVEPPKFDISNFNSDSPNHATDKVECGTSACFCGYGPLAGIVIAPRQPGYYNESWAVYSERVFGVGMWGDLYHLLFDANHTNTKEAAVLRGAYFLMHGLPKIYDDLRFWEVPSNFKPNWLSIRAVASAK